MKVLDLLERLESTLGRDFPVKNNVYVRSDFPPSEGRPFKIIRMHAGGNVTIRSVNRDLVSNFQSRVVSRINLTYRGVVISWIWDLPWNRESL